MHKKSFTLVELMLVIAILAILAAIAIFVLNPARLFNNFQDVKRISDISTINKIIVFMESWEQNGLNYGTSTNLYISLPDDNPSCTSYALSILPSGYAYYCSSLENYKKTDGTGWIPLNFSTADNKYLSLLPVDPTNDTTYFYTYFPGGSYELTAYLKNLNDNSLHDQGSLTGVFELGTPNRIFSTPLQRDKGLVGFWDFNETIGGVGYDKSGNGNDGHFTNGASRAVALRSEKTLILDGRDDYIRISHNDNLNPINLLTVTAWIKAGEWRANHWDGVVVGKVDWAGAGSRGYELRTGNNGMLSFLIGDGSNWLERVDATLMSTTEWYYVVGEFDGSALKTYINGSFVSEKIIGNKSISPTTYDLNIGRCPFAAERVFNGYIDNIRIYNRVVSEEELGAIYNWEKGKYQ